MVDLSPQTQQGAILMDLDKEMAMAKLIAALVETDPQKIKVLTDLTPGAINGISALLAYENWSNAFLPEQYKSTLMKDFTVEFITYRISKNRLSRAELIKALQNERENEKEERGLLGIGGNKQPGVL